MSNFQITTLLGQTSDIDPVTTAIFCAVFGFVTIVMSLIIAVSQLHMMAKTRNTSGTSLLTYVIFIVMSLISLSWGMTFYFNSGAPKETSMELHQLTLIPMIICYFSDLVYAVAMTIIKSHHILLARKLHKTEFELSIYLQKKLQKKYVESKHNIIYSKYFWFVMLLLGMVAIIAIFGALFTIYTQDVIMAIGDSKPINTNLIIALSILAAFSWEAISWPQFIKCIKYRDTSGIALNWAIFLPIGCVITFTYALLLGLSGDEGFDLEVLGGLIFNGMIVNFGILGIKLQNIRRAKKLYISELEYTKIKLLPKIKADQKKIIAKIEKKEKRRKKKRA